MKIAGFSGNVNIRDNGERTASRCYDIIVGAKEVQRSNYNLGTSAAAVTVPVSLVTPVQMVAVDPEKPIYLKVGGSHVSNGLKIHGPFIMHCDDALTITIANYETYSEPGNDVTIWIVGG